jgi:hypothetical protein
LIVQPETVNSWMPECVAVIADASRRAFFEWSAANATRVALVLKTGDYDLDTPMSFCDWRAAWVSIRALGSKELRRVPSGIRESWGIRIPDRLTAVRSFSVRCRSLVIAVDWSTGFSFAGVQG